MEEKCLKEVNDVVNELEAMGFQVHNYNVDESYGGVSNDSEGRTTRLNIGVEIVKKL